MCTAELPEAQQIFDELIVALLDEFRKIRETLPNLGKKHIKHKLGLCMHAMKRRITAGLLRVDPAEWLLQ